MLTLAVENLSGPFFPIDIGGFVRSSDGFVYPQASAGVVELPRPYDTSSPAAADRTLIPPGFRVPATLTIDVASNAHDPTVSLCVLVVGPPLAVCGGIRLAVSLAAVPPSGSASFAAPGPLAVGATFTQGPLSFSATGFRIYCNHPADEVTVHVKSTYGYPLKVEANLEVFDPAGRVAGARGWGSVPPGGSLDLPIVTTSGYGHGCGGSPGAYVGVLQLVPLVGDPSATQALAGPETIVLTLPSPIHDATP